MRLGNISRHPARSRSGKTILLFVLVLPALIGMIGLTVDIGLLLAAYRQTRNAADAAAVAAAQDLYQGQSNDTALTTANSFLTNDGMSATLALNGGATNALNIPPQDPTNTGSPYKGKAHYAEVIVSQTVKTFFIQVLGVNSTQTVTARAVAGYDLIPVYPGVFVLDPTAAPGLSVNNSQTRLIVNGAITVNSRGAGWDQFGKTVASAYSPDAVNTSANSTPAPTANDLGTPVPITAMMVNVSGGVSFLNDIRTFDPAFSANGDWYDTTNTDVPVNARAPQAADPYYDPSNFMLPTPTTQNPGIWQVVNVNYGSVDASKGPPANFPQGLNNYVPGTNTVILNPGIYSDIAIGAYTDKNGKLMTVTFMPGIYVLTGGSTNVINITGGTVNNMPGGVMFYNTASTYDPKTGKPDKLDGNTTPVKNNGIGGGMQITGGNVNLTPLTGDSTSPFDGILFYQRRWNTNNITIAGSTDNVNLSGAMYAKWALFTLSGKGNYQARFIVGSMSIKGGANIFVPATGQMGLLAAPVYLVE